jgi:hypothetical protein
MRGPWLFEEPGSRQTRSVAGDQPFSTGAPTSEPYSVHEPS